MTTPDQYKLTIPYYQPSSPDQFDTDFRAIARRVNDLPFPMIQIHGGTFSPPPTVTNASPLQIHLYPQSVIPDGFVLPTSGIILSTVLVPWSCDTADTGNNMFVTAFSDISSFGPANWYNAWPDGLGTCRGVLSSQFYHLLTPTNLSWKPIVEVFCGVATGVIIEGISADHKFYPDGLWNQFNTHNLP